MQLPQRPRFFELVRKLAVHVIQPLLFQPKARVHLLDRQRRALPQRLLPAHARLALLVQLLEPGVLDGRTRRRLLDLMPMLPCHERFLAVALRQLLECGCVRCGSGGLLLRKHLMPLHSDLAVDNPLPQQLVLPLQLVPLPQRGVSMLLRLQVPLPEQIGLHLQLGLRPLCGPRRLHEVCLGAHEARDLALDLLGERGLLETPSVGLGRQLVPQAFHDACLLHDLAYGPLRLLLLSDLREPRPLPELALRKRQPREFVAVPLAKARLFEAPDLQRGEALARELRELGLFRQEGLCALRPQFLHFLTVARLLCGPRLLSKAKLHPRHQFLVAPRGLFPHVCSNAPLLLGEALLHTKLSAHVLQLLGNVSRHRLENWSRVKSLVLRRVLLIAKTPLGSRPNRRTARRRGWRGRGMTLGRRALPWSHLTALRGSTLRQSDTVAVDGRGVLPGAHRVRR
mmetsp:Transcript_16525/g.45132  ORF Transcript_16525/g.45132 Transcript_16525/m.45132 type:complete len:455 (+) Transcript_16525:1749-3113(+)